MPDASVNIGGNAAGAIAACMEAQAAIDSLTGKVVVVDIVTRGGGLGDAAAGLGKVGDAARGARDHAADLNDHLDRMAEHSSRAGSGVRSTADIINLLNRTSRDAADSVGRLGDTAQRTHSALSGMGRGVDSPVDVGSIAAGTDHLTALHAAASKLAELGQGQRAITAGPTGPRAGFTASSAGEIVPGSVGRDLARMQDGMGGAARSIDDVRNRTSSAGKELERFGGSARSAVAPFEGSLFHTLLGEGAREAAGARAPIDAIGRVLGDAADGAGGMERAFSLAETSTSALGKTAGIAATGLKTVGLAGIIGAAGMGILGAATAGVGIGGVLEDFAHVPGMMHETENVQKSWAKGFKSSMSEVRAEGIPALAALSTAVKGVSTELGQIGARNVSTVLGGATALANTATQTMRQLEPAIKPAEQALVSLGGATMQALGASAPEIGRFSNILTSNMPGIEQAAEGTVRTLSVLGGATAEVVGAYGPAIKSGAEGLANVADFSLGVMGIPSNLASPAGPGGEVSAKPSTASTLGNVAKGAGAGAALGAGLGAGLFGIGAVPGAAIGAVIGGATGYATAPTQVPHVVDASGFPIGVSAPYGWDQNEQGQMKPSPAPTRSSSGSTSSRSAPAQDAQKIYDQQYKAATGADHPGAPRYSGLGPPGPGDLPAPTLGGGGGGPGQLQGRALGQSLTQSMLQELQGGAPAVQSAAQQLVQGAGQAASQAAPQAGQAGAQIGQHTAQQMQQAAPQMAQAAGQFGQHAAQGVQQAAPAVQQAAQAIPPAISSGLSQMAPQMAQPAGQAVQQAARHVQDVGVGAAETSGAAVGGAIGAGMAAGTTSSMTVTDTVIRKHVKKIIDVAADILGISSPSRVFAGFGMNIGQGLAQGISNSQGLAASAAGQMAGGAVAAGQKGAGTATQKTGWTTGGAVTDPGWRPNGGSAVGWGAYPPGTGPPESGFPAPGAGWRASGGVDLNDPMWSGPNPANQSRADPTPAPGVDPNRAALERRGFSPATNDRVLQRQAEHNDRADLLASERQTRHEDAKTAARQGITPQEATRQWVADQQAKDAGAAIPKQVADGAQGQQPGLLATMGKIAVSMVDDWKKKWGISSPSTVFAGIGGDAMAGLGVGVNAGTGGAASAVGSAMSSTTTAAQGPASDAGLRLGYAYARSVVTGAQVVLKRDLFQAIGTPKIENEQAQAALGKAGLLGPAGSGASIYKTPAVTFGGQQRQTVNVNVQVDLKSDLLDARTDTRIQNFRDGLIGEITDALVNANG